MKKYFVAIMMLTGVFLTSCEDDPTVTRSKELLIYAPPYDIYVGDSYSFQAVLYQLNDTRTWSWSAELGGTEIGADEGEYFDILFDEVGTYTVSLAESDREGSVEVDVLSKILSLDGDTLAIGDTDEDLFIPLSFDAFAYGDASVSFSLGGTAVEGVDYEVLSANPILLNIDSPEEDYGIYIRLLPDVAGVTTKYITVTLTSVDNEITDEFAITDEPDETKSVIAVTR